MTPTPRWKQRGASTRATTSTTRPGRTGGNSRNGTRTKTALTEIGPVEIGVPRDTGSSFDPQIVCKRQLRPTGVDEIVLSLSAKTAGHRRDRRPLRRRYGVKVSTDTTSRITGKVVAEMTEWANRGWTVSTR